MTNFENELELLLKCKTPILEVVTYEWQRLQSTISSISKFLKMKKRIVF